MEIVINSINKETEKASAVLKKGYSDNLLTYVEFVYDLASVAQWSDDCYLPYEINRDKVEFMDFSNCYHSQIKIQAFESAKDIFESAERYQEFLVLFEEYHLVHKDFFDLFLLIFLLVLKNNKKILYVFLIIFVSLRLFSR